MKINMNKLELVEKVRQILDSSYEDPAEQIIKEGEALAQIGYALKGLNIHDARAAIKAVAVLEGIDDARAA